MCGGVEAREAEKAFKVYFPSPKAAFPVVLVDGGELGWVRWGKREGESGIGPRGGWAKLETIERGGWDKYRPRPALGLVDRFMEKDGQRTSHWFDVPNGYALRCLVMGEGDDQRVFVVTSRPPEEYAWVHDRWPQLALL